MEYITIISSPLGELTVRFDDNAITGLWLPNQRHTPDLTCCPILDNHPLANQAREWLQEYFLGHIPPLPPVKPKGTDFQLEIWKILGSIPYGNTISYGQIADLIGRPTASRAVGSAVSRNPVSILIPCHRVIAASGHLSGYAGGLKAKEFLLHLENNSK